MNKFSLFTAIFSFFCALSLHGQSLEVIQPFQAVPNSSVLASYKNQFGSWQQGDSFPYALIRVGLEGNAYEVIAAKQLLRLSIDGHSTETATYKDMQNELLFLVPNSAKQIYITCGSNGTQQLILNAPNQLEANTVYVGRVHYQPKQDYRLNTTDKVLNLRQFFLFRVSPQDAHVTVQVNGINQSWETEDGIAYQILPHGSYHYAVSADGYQTQRGIITVSDQSRELRVELLPLL